MAAHANVGLPTLAHVETEPDDCGPGPSGHAGTRFRSPALVLMPEPDDSGHPLVVMPKRDLLGGCCPVS
jgi:hypothetical protein